MAEEIKIVFPLQDYPVTEESGRVTLPWSRFFTALYFASSGSIVPVNGAVVLRLQPDGTLGAYSVATGALLGVIPLENNPGGVEENIPATGSPQVYAAPNDGNLIVFSAQVEISRNAGVTWHKASLQGGSFALKTADRARMTWFSALPPEMTWLPNYPT